MHNLFKNTLKAICLLAGSLGFSMFSAQNSSAQDAYYALPVSSLMLTDGALPIPAERFDRNWQASMVVRSYATLDGPGEVYVASENFNRWTPENPNTQTIAICAPPGRELSGRLFVPNSDRSGMVVLKFKVPESAMTNASKQFFITKAAAFRRLLDRGCPGADRSWNRV